MWRKEDANPQVPEVSPQSSSSGNVRGSSSPTSTQASTHKPTACVSQGIKIKGEVTGTEDLFIDGTIEGKISLGNAGLTVGPNGTVRAEISAREVVLRGVAEGKFTADERIQIWHTARVQGELKSERISIEDGAELRGKVEAGKVTSKAATPEPAGRNKKSEHNKPNETTAKDVNATPGTATAGAD
ncbi:MAG TPA: polymer-forming cytoskeletal protein [Candidatus Eremiobacteraceae bacterium]|nr:polymer-forming cytoskeletal protein [Candidatus Eremiobacteraceae bacterium]